MDAEEEREEAEARLVEFCVSMSLTLNHPRFVELAPYFQDAEDADSTVLAVTAKSGVQRRVDALSIGRSPCA